MDTYDAFTFAFHALHAKMRFMEDAIRKARGFPKLLAIVGPTATGKSDLAISLAKILNAEIISADSMQVYRYMDIGTAKPSKDIRAVIPHHFIDILNPDESFSAGEFARQTHRLISKKIRGGIPLIVVGGTGLYVKALERGLVALPPVPDEIHARLWEEYINTGLPHLYDKLCKIDPATASSVHPNDRFRILRALGVFETTGKPLSSFRTHHGFRETAVHLRKIGLTYPREILYKRIETRVEQMIENGWMEEVKTLLEMGYNETLKPMQAIGYKQLVSVIKGTLKMRDAVEEIKKETRHLAKRQITWFNKETPQQWISLRGENLEEEAEILLTFIQKGDKIWNPKKA